MDHCINKFFLFNDEVEYAENFEKLYPIGEKIVYEVIRIIEGKPLFLKEHVFRLHNSLKLINSEDAYTYEYIKFLLDKLIKVNEVDNGNIKFIISGKEILVYSIPHFYPGEEMYREGVKTILYFGERTNPNAKVIDNEFRHKVNEEIKKADAYEGILINNNGFVTEGSKSNIFMVKGDLVYTAPVKGVLPGITREKIIDCCKSIGLVVEEKDVHYSEIASLDGMFISGTSPKVLPIKEVQSEVQFEKIYFSILNIKEAFEKNINEDLNGYDINMY